MPLSTHTIQEYNNLISKLECSGWDIIGAYWVHYAHEQKNLCITATGLNQINLNLYRQSLYNAIEDLRPKSFSIYDVRICGDDEFHSGIFHLEEKEEHVLLNNVFFKGTFLKELYIFRCLESESTRKYPPREKVTLFKYFKNPQFKDDFLNGKAWIGTLSNYRKIENKNQGDTTEGETFYNTTQVITDDNVSEIFNTKPIIKDMLQNAHFPGEDMRVTLSNITVSLPDSYVLCFSKHRDDELFKHDFGEFCVKINDAEKFFFLLSISMKELDSEINIWNHDEIEYIKKPLTDFSERLFTIFHKPSEQYKWQDEYRFAWAKNNNENLTPFLLDISRHLPHGLLDDLA
ncbi:Uncharacterised protein [Raoultella ornithinolytica]|uniref:hypothetical protein n=1 Tax=Raoultella ornithinolytica TaxID=54291 RepID=UPI0007CC125B|nr:hypothetical protein [Raoultella ornithinolytica]SBL23395.1 Uncharacterised protein [Raoultella ornithinolytica]